MFSLRLTLTALTALALVASLPAQFGTPPASQPASQPTSQPAQTTTGFQEIANVPAIANFGNMTQAEIDAMGTVIPAGQSAVVVRNGYTITQYIFIDGQFVGTVAVNDTGAWTVPPGQQHTVTSCDSQDINDYPVSDSFSLDPGEFYTFGVIVTN